MNICIHYTTDPDGVDRTNLGALVRLTHEELEAVQRMAASEGLEADAWLGNRLRPHVAQLLAFSGPGWGPPADSHP